MNTIDTTSAITHEHYEGFWKRFFAACIDLALYMPVYIGLRYLFDIVALHIPGLPLTSVDADFASAASRPSEIYRWWFESFFGIFALGTYAWFFSSKWQASPGMHLLKFRITDGQGNRISYMRALAWGVTGTFGWLICCAGILYLQKDIQAVHDMLISCQEQKIDAVDCIPEIEKVIGIPFASFERLMYAAAGLCFFMFLIWALSIALPKDKTGFHNLICNTRFLKGRP